jgi:hypothetical protein
MFFYFLYMGSGSDSFKFYCHLSNLQMSTSAGGGKVSFFLTFQLTSPRLTYQMMESINFSVDEIVTSRDTALTYVYIHLQRKVRTEELENAIMTLAITHGVTGSNIFGYDTVNGNSVGSSDFIEDHPGFKTLVQHEVDGNDNFHRWTVEDYPRKRGGYSLLKNRLLGKRVSAPTSSGAGSSSAASSGRSNAIDGEARVVPPFPDGGSSSGGENGGKRRRSVTPPPPASLSAPALMDSRSGHIPNVDMFNYMKNISDLLIASLKQQLINAQDEIQQLKAAVMITEPQEDDQMIKTVLLTARLREASAECEEMKTKFAAGMEEVCASSYSRFPHTFPFCDTLFIHNDNADP